MYKGRIQMGLHVLETTPSLNGASLIWLNKNLLQIIWKLKQVIAAGLFSLQKSSTNYV